jgi:transcriptional regulator with XRE-family HTH domain
MARGVRPARIRLPCSAARGEPPCLREQVGLTREELAAGAGMGVELLIELKEASRAIPSIGLFLRLVGTLGRRPSELVAGVD